MIRILLFSCLLPLGLCDFLLCQTQAEVVWEKVDSLKEKSSPVIWEPINNSSKLKESQLKWDAIDKPGHQNQSPSMVIWEEIEAEEETSIPTSQKESNSRFTPPSNLVEAEALLDTIPLQPSDYKPLINLSHAVPTASVLSHGEWRLISSTISPFQFAEGTGNQNYAI